ncbi:hypothetical protein CAI21_03335 [Alkalilimnicola ehrlichii]|uniref:Membrane-anchored protein n=1 Tax=Alkalilimnicola ehrlichii TaxID=351052 RepID=A0A3E0X2W0_9GAMM|nr:hypothetical protein CAI21_03335 [Alkalilimnicola ehrlichii]RFA38971.1 hypothetical protein CAL65_03485 [Alkalilimnicola ehrlichii]
MTDHPLRDTVCREVHARPFETLTAPARVSHIALVAGPEAAAEEHACLTDLCRRFGVAVPAPGAVYLSAEFGPFRLRWERHSEFSTYTFFRSGAAGKPFLDPALDQVPCEWLARLPGKVLAAIHLAVESKDVPVRDVRDVVALFGTDNIAGSQVGRGAAVVWTDFRVHEDGFGRILVQDSHLGTRQAGRLVQRLLEIETYRLMALLAFPLARETGPEIVRLDKALQTLTERMTANAQLEDEQAMLRELSRLAAEVERINSRNSYRLGAARAYYQLVQRRIESLKEQRIQDLQTIGQFMERRLAPAMATCESIGGRQDALARRVARAGNLLRTRVDVALEAQNRDLLESMNGRAQMQLRLQETVEGLSVVVLSYYAMGLLSYGAKAAHSAGWPIRVDLTLGLAVPIVVGSVWLGVRWLRRRLLGRH